MFLRRITLLAVLLALVPCNVSAQSKKSKAADAWKVDSSNMPKRPPAATSCAQYGAGFVRMPGSDTCVRMGGGVEVGVGVGPTNGR